MINLKPEMRSNINLFIVIITVFISFVIFISRQKIITHMLFMYKT